MHPHRIKRVICQVRSWFFLAVIFFLAFAGPSCKKPIKGEFGWASTDDRGIEEPEKSLLVETEFHLGRKNIYFFDYETIWWIYRIQSGTYSANKFLAVLYENNGTPEPVELDLRHVQVLKEGLRGVIRQYYEPLKPGNYILKIAYGSNIVDQVSFEVVPEGGPAALRPEDILDSDEGTSGLPDDSDEILKFSR